MISKKIDWDLRRKVAELDGWEEIRTFTLSINGRRFAEGKPLGDYAIIPEYEVSFDAIAEACDQHGIKFDMETIEYANKQVDDYRARQVSEEHTDADLDGEGNTRAIALCNLFVLVMESRKTQKEEDRYLLTKALILRRKVATLAGWTDFFIGEVNHELWGKPPLSSSSVKAPHYEDNVGAVIRLLLANGIKYERDSFADHIDTSPKNILYTDRKTRITSAGETNAIALCNLFVAVMESRLAGKELSTSAGEGEGKYTSSNPERGNPADICIGSIKDPTGRYIPLVIKKVELNPVGEQFFMQHKFQPPATSVGEQFTEWVSIGRPFTREICQNIAEKALNSIAETTEMRWDQAFEELAIAADRIDAMLARKELIELKNEIKEDDG